jgi:hypothetical protein
MFCNACGTKNPLEASFCSKCGAALAGAPGKITGPTAMAARASDDIGFPNIRESLDPSWKAKLLPGEAAYAFLQAPRGGCSRGKPSTLIITDSRVILDGVPVRASEGCASGIKSLEIPISHVSGVSQETIASGCSTSKGLGISSGSAIERARVRTPKELDGAIRILQALIRAAHSRR